LRLEEVSPPSLRDDSVLVRVRAVSVNPYDWHFMRGEPYFMRLFSGLRAPRRCRLGADFAGQVESVGKNVEDFQVGDEVYGLRDGAFAEYLCAPGKEVARKPRNLSFEHAASVPMAGLTALQGLRDSGQLQREQRVLIIGASGGVGTLAVQIAKHLGAHVTGVCSTRNIEMVRSLGADEIIDYTQQDFTESAENFDVIFQLAGMRSPSDCRRALTPKGILVLSSGDSEGRWIGPLDRIFNGLALSPFVSQKLVSLNTKRSKKDLQILAELIEAGTISTVIDRTLSFGETPEAMRYIASRAWSHVRVAVRLLQLWHRWLVRCGM
jgi:NADPH:quinone reductase-like Zn-dependent oxidoreductase